jgi:hypothetical protein
MGVPARTATGSMRVPVAAPTDETENVLADLALRRHAQIQQWGHNETMDDGTGPDVRWAIGMAVDSSGTLHADTCPATYGAVALEEMVRTRYDRKVQRGGVEALTWVDILLEEMTEAFCEDDPAKLYSELADVGAVVISWMEKIRQR